MISLGRVDIRRTLVSLRRACMVAALAGTAFAPSGWARPVPPVPCTPRDLSWLQADSAGWVIAVATGDSAIAGTWNRPAWWDSVGRDTAGPRRLDVYGQWATIERASDPRVVGTRALFVRWSTGGMCEPEPSLTAHAFAPGTRFFAGGSRRADAIGGVAVHDITAFTPEYAGRFVKDDPPEDWLSVDEYAVFYDAMPALAQWLANRPVRRRDIRAWARANPSLSARQPVRWALDAMETDFAISMDAWRDEGRWPRDSLIQEPGSWLRPGLRMLYRSDTEQLWTIDSLSPDTALAGVPHCVRMRLRTSPQAPAGTRAFCVRGGVLHSYDGVTQQLRPARPLLPGQRLTIAAANRSTLLFETDSLDVQMAGGYAFDLLFTTITTMDSTGRAIRRLRESFAPALLTATEGTFEVPDSTAAAGWRVVSSFRLADIDPQRIR